MIAVEVAVVVAIAAVDSEKGVHTEAACRMKLEHHMDLQVDPCYFSLLS